MKPPIIKRMAWLGLLATLAACDQSSQSLPFGIDEETTRTITADGGTITSPAGVSLTLPAGAVSGPATITLREIAPPSGVPGTPSSQAFSITSPTAQLDAPAELEIRLAEDVDPASAWMASVVGSADGVIDEYPNGRIDLSTGFLSSDIGRFASFMAVIPPPAVIFPVEPETDSARPSIAVLPSFAGVTIDSIAVECGQPASRCAGLSATASGNLLNMVSASALLYPRIAGTLRIGEESVTGSINARATLRILLESERTAESIEVNALLEPTAETTVIQTPNEIHLTNVRQRISGSVYGIGQTTEEITTLVIPRSDGAGLVSVRRPFEIRVAGGNRETAAITFTFPVTLYE